MAHNGNGLTGSDVSRIAKLSNLTVTESEIKKLTHDLSKILAYIGKLNELDTSQTPPTNQATGLTMVTREDTVTSDTVLSNEEALSNAPSKKNGYFEVEAVFDNY